LIRTVALATVTRATLVINGRYDSYLGHNSLLCAHRYNCNVDELDGVAGGSADKVINSYNCHSALDSQLRTACFFRELTFIGDNVLVLPNTLLTGFAQHNCLQIIYLYMPICSLVIQLHYTFACLYVVEHDLDG
jgi:hypothetical protein